MNVQLRVVLLSTPSDPAPNESPNPLVVWNGATVQTMISQAVKIFGGANISFVFDPTHGLVAMPDPVVDLGTPDTTSYCDMHSPALTEDWSMKTGVLNLYLREGSGGESDIGNAHFAVAIKSLAYELQVAHEIGHSLGLHHVFNETSPLIADQNQGVTLAIAGQFADTFLAGQLNKLGVGSADQLSEAQWIQVSMATAEALADFFDGDTPDKIGAASGVTDTPGSIQDWPAGYPPIATVPNPTPMAIQTSVMRGGKAQSFTVDIQLDNIMGYAGQPYSVVLSPQQCQVVQKTILQGTGIHLLGPAVQWSGWQSLGGTPVGSPAVGYLGRGLVYLNAILSDATPLEWATGPGGPNAPQPVWRNIVAPGGQTPYAPALAFGDNGAHAFFANAKGGIYTTFFTSNLVFSPWAELPGNGITASSPCAGVYQGIVYATAMGPTGRLYYTSNAGGERFAPNWIEFAGGGVGSASPALIEFNASLFAIVPGPTGQLYYNWALDGVRFQSFWTRVEEGSATPSFLTGFGVSAAVISNCLFLFAVRQSDGVVCYNVRPVSGAFVGWAPVPGAQVATSAVSALGAGDGSSLTLVAKGQDGAVWQTVGTALRL